MHSQHFEFLPLGQEHLVRCAAGGIELELACRFGREAVERFVVDPRENRVAQRGQVVR